MDGDLGLFGEELESVAPPPPSPTPVADWQRDLIRKALDARGLASMDDRQRAVEEAAGRPLENLRDLTHDEAIAVLNRLGQTRTAAEPSSSLWDARDEDTWIDRL